MELKPHLVHETVRAEMNAARAGTRGTKSRGLVAGGRSKPWRQKGTGRARAGTTRAPHWTGGGVAFAPGMRSFEVKVNRKARRSALQGRALAPRRRVGRSRSSTAPASTRRRRKQAAELLSGFGERPTLVVVAEDEELVIKSFRNLEKVLVIAPAELEVASLVWARSVLISEAALPLVLGRAGVAQDGGGGGPMSLHPNQVLLAPVVSEKSYSLITDRKYTFKVHEDAHKTQIRQAVEELFDVKVAGRQHHQGAVEAEAARLHQGPPAGLEEGDRGAEGGLRDRDLRRGGRLMALKKYKPTSPGRRFMATSGFEEVTKSEPEKSLLEPVTKKGGRNNRGRITTRHQGGGHKRRFRTIDFKRTKDGVPAKVAAIEYDPNRSARIALLHYVDGVEVVHPRPGAAPRRLDRRVGPGGGHQARQRAPAREHPDRHARPLRRAEARTGRAHGALGRLGDPARREGRPARSAPAAVR